MFGPSILGLALTIAPIDDPAPFNCEPKSDTMYLTEGALPETARTALGLPPPDEPPEERIGIMGQGGAGFLHACQRGDLMTVVIEVGGAATHIVVRLLKREHGVWQEVPRETWGGR